MSVKDGIGPGGALMLIVPSNVAQRLIVNRLKRKRIVDASGAARSDMLVLREIAEKVFDESRKIASRLMSDKKLR